MNSEELSDRFLDYATSIIILLKSLGNSYQGKHISKQLLRSATSCGANYEEARAAESKADFSHKLPRRGAFLKETSSERHKLYYPKGIPKGKELRESRFWIRLIKRASLIPKDKISPILSETDELIKIIAKSVVTSKIKKII